MRNLNISTRSLVWAAILLLTASGCAENPPEVQQVQATPPAQKTPTEQPTATPVPTGKVIAVKDGDTIVVLKDKDQITVRLEGIDCPESGQAFGAKAKQAASDLCFGKQVSLRVTGKDRYGRTLADVILPDGGSLNQELVRSGYAWWFRKYSDDPTLKKLEDEAKANKRGLWADSRSIAPWDWRAARRAKSDSPPSEIEVVSNGVEIVALLPNPAGEDAGNEQVTIKNSTDADPDEQDAIVELDERAILQVAKEIRARQAEKRTEHQNGKTVKPQSRTKKQRLKATGLIYGDCRQELKKLRLRMGSRRTATKSPS